MATTVGILDIHGQLISALVDGSEERRETGILTPRTRDATDCTFLLLARKARFELIVMLCGLGS